MRHDPDHPSVQGRLRVSMPTEPYPPLPPDTCLTLAESRQLWIELAAMLELEEIFAKLPEEDS